MAIEDRGGMISRDKRDLCTDVTTDPKNMGKSFERKETGKGGTRRPKTALRKILFRS